MRQPIEGQTRHDAFAAYVLPEIEVLLRVARSLTRQPADAEDLVQETLLRAYRAIERFDCRHPRAWLLTILRNARANRGRGRRPEILSDIEAERSAAPVDEGPEAVVMRGTFDAAVERAFVSLPDKFRRVVEVVVRLPTSETSDLEGGPDPASSPVEPAHHGPHRFDDCRRCGMEAETYEEIKRALRRSAGPAPASAVARLRAFGQQLADGWVARDEHQQPAGA